VRGAGAGAEGEGTLGGADRRVVLKGFEGSGLYLSTCPSFPSIQSLDDCAETVKGKAYSDQSRQTVQEIGDFHRLTSRRDFGIQVLMEIDVLSSRNIDRNWNDSVLSKHDQSVDLGFHQV